MLSAEYSRKAASRLPAPSGSRATLPEPGAPFQGRRIPAFLRVADPPPDGQVSAVPLIAADQYRCETLRVCSLKAAPSLLDQLPFNISTQREGGPERADLTLGETPAPDATDESPQIGRVRRAI